MEGAAEMEGTESGREVHARCSRRMNRMQFLRWHVRNLGWSQKDANYFWRNTPKMVGLDGEETALVGMDDETLMY